MIDEFCKKLEKHLSDIGISATLTPSRVSNSQFRVHLKAIVKTNEPKVVYILQVSPIGWSFKSDRGNGKIGVNLGWNMPDYNDISQVTETINDITAMCQLVQQHPLHTAQHIRNNIAIIDQLYVKTRLKEYAHIASVPLGQSCEIDENGSLYIEYVIDKVEVFGSTPDNYKYSDKLEAVSYLKKRDMGHRSNLEYKPTVKDMNTIEAVNQIVTYT